MKIDKEKVILDKVTTLINSLGNGSFDTVFRVMMEDTHIGEDMKREICKRTYEVLTGAVARLHDS